MPEPLVTTVFERGVGQVTLNRPSKRNALTRELLADLLRALREFRTNDSLRALLLCATGPVFCAGMDLSQMEETASRADARDVWMADTRLYKDVVWELIQT